MNINPRILVYCMELGKRLFPHLTVEAGAKLVYELLVMHGKIIE